MVLQDIFLNETARYADVILPAACFAEKDGVFTNSDRRVQRVRKAVDPPGAARADWQILSDFARHAGYPMPELPLIRARSSPSSLPWRRSSAASATSASIEKADCSGHAPTRLIRAPTSCTRAVHWWARRSFQGQWSIVPATSCPIPEYPLVLSTGRTLYQYNAATQTLRDSGIACQAGRRHSSRCIATTPMQLGVEHGAMVRVDISPRCGGGAGRCQRIVCEEGCVWMPMHFGERSSQSAHQRCGRRRRPALAEYKVCAVRIEGV